MTKQRAKTEDERARSGEQEFNPTGDQNESFEGGN